MSSSENRVNYIKKELPAGVKKLGLVLMAIGLIVVILGYLSDPVRSAFNNIILLMFLTSIGVGSLFLVAIEYVGGAVWSTPFRRVPEFLAAIILILPVIAAPIYFNFHDVFQKFYQNQKCHF